MTIKGFNCRSGHLLSAWPKLTNKQREHLGSMHLHYEREFAKLRDHELQESVAVALYELVEKAIEGQAKATPGTHARIRCTRGCAHCCKQNVTITKAEAALLLMAKPDIDWARVERQSAFAGSDRWHEQPVEDRACVFLDANNDCTIYPVRPMACRKHFVVNDPERCDIVRFRGTQTLNWVALEAEVIASAAMMALDEGSLPVMLRELHERGHRAEQDREQVDHDDDREHRLGDGSEGRG